MTIVDNDSADGRPPGARGGPARTGSTLDLADSNLGYGRRRTGRSPGARPRWSASATPTSGPSRAALAELAAVARRDPRAGMVGPALEGDDDIYHAELPRPVALLGQIFAGSFMRRAGPEPGAAASSARSASPPAPAS